MAVAHPVRAECVAVAIVDGDPSLASPLKAELVSRGIAIADDVPNACLPMRADVSRHGVVVLIHIVEPHGVSVDRAVSNVAIAATWIESRLRTSVGAPLLLARAPTAPAAHADPPPAVVETVNSPGDRWSLAAHIATGSSGDPSSWRAYSLGGCAMVGQFCLGLLAHMGTQPSVEGPGSATNPMLLLPSLARRRSTDFLVTAQMPLEVGRVVVVPTVGVGLGSLTTEQHANTAIAQNDPTCIPNMINECPLRIFSDTNLGLRTMVGLNLWFPITDHVKLDIRAGAQFAPMHGGPLVDQQTYNEFCRDPNIGPECERIDFSYAAEPLYVLRAGIGLRVSL